MKLRKKETKKEDLTDIVDKITENFNDELTEEVNEIEDIINDEEETKEEVKEVKAKKIEIKEKKEEPMSKRTRKKFKIDLSIIVFVAILLLVAGVVVFLTIGNGGNKYGERLKGIEKIKFNNKDKNKLVDGLKGNENVNSASLNDSLNNLSDEVKAYYDINALITKKEEKGTEETRLDADGKEEKIIHKEFPISGYKNNSSDHIVW